MPTEVGSRADGTHACPVPVVVDWLHRHLRPPQ
ncbi:hypothetical protein Ae406Ps2_0417c [Pseudonocardia sp. Ae406_Ps2]|nr:hypothetical protein Ae406Ps2_0417c [Pseudonocardia sp. Ae406_Ps2]OLM07790.1 hypothetical protein Ae331Ps2_5500 [Pseudonocardia sp. Ae331_Ps2]OLM13964.1 hypothetical protein Ae505Ps2_4093c [Pseudonocardia sp. Ae505_Ps2]OLM21991.1 hypothetical protein Ae706Ps2_0423c [Pseudonocardia sp. Ae706_Ps2]